MLFYKQLSFLLKNYYISVSFQASNTSPLYTDSSPQATDPILVPTHIPVVTSGQGIAICGAAPQSIFPTPVPNYATMDSFVPYSNSSSTDSTKDQSVEKSSSLLQQQQQQHRSIFDAFIVPGGKFDMFYMDFSPSLTKFSSLSLQLNGENIW